MMDEQLRLDVAQRARSAESEKELCRIIYESLAANCPCCRSVGSEGVKQLLVDAMRAYRESHGPAEPQVAV